MTRFPRCSLKGGRYVVSPLVSDLADETVYKGVKMVAIEGYVYIRTGSVTIMPIPIASVAEFEKATDAQRSAWIIITVSINKFNDITSSRNQTVH